MNPSFTWAAVVSISTQKMEVSHDLDRVLFVGSGQLQVQQEE